MRIIEFAGIGPGPFCGMVLADLGASVLRIERPTESDLGIKRPRKFDLTQRGKHCVRLDLKDPKVKAQILDLTVMADGLIEGFRPGVMERLGYGPDTMLSANPRLVYGRLTGWGQTGPLSQTAGHDLNYLALTGALGAIGRAGSPPTPPLNLIGDYAGGSLYLALGMLAAILNARTTGTGTVIDAAIIDGVGSLMTHFHGAFAAGQMTLAHGQNMLDSGAPFYDVYQCKDGKWLAVAPIEDRFYLVFLTGLGLKEEKIPDRKDRANWPKLREVFSTELRKRTRDEWAVVFEQTDACVTPVLTLAELPDHGHHQSRGGYYDVSGVIQSTSAPRFVGRELTSPVPIGSHSEADGQNIIRAWLT